MLLAVKKEGAEEKEEKEKEKEGGKKARNAFPIACRACCFPFLHSTASPPTVRYLPTCIYFVEFIHVVLRYTYTYNYT